MKYDRKLDAGGPELTMREKKFTSIVFGFMSFIVNQIILSLEISTF